MQNIIFFQIVVVVAVTGTYKVLMLGKVAVNLKVDQACSDDLNRCPASHPGDYLVVKLFI